MKGIEAIKALRENECQCSALLRVGVIHPGRLMYAEIYEYHEARLAHHRKARVTNWKGEALADTVNRYGISKDTVYRIKRELA